MAEVLLFHHAQGQTAGFHAFADELRGAGHTVHTPDLFDGRTFGSIEEGMAYVEQLGFPAIIEAGERAANELPEALVYAGFSLGVVPAQKLAQTRPGGRGALLFYSCVPVEKVGSWPAGVPVYGLSPLLSWAQLCNPYAQLGAFGLAPGVFGAGLGSRFSAPYAHPQMTVGAW